ncbi:MAG: prolipoprotein diacylglyceryl transferase [Oscillospiraceae bacterium]|nr:prolipoprotein diacylglyceryl transferase [Oscillospiraceae bacterium]
MEKLAFISNGSFIYWSSIILTLAAVTAIAAFAALYYGKSGNILAIGLMVPMSVGGSLVLSRLIHWLCCGESYTSLSAALTDHSSGGYALAGIFAACLLCALLLRLVGVVKNLPQMLDCLALAGGIGIALGRLASFFNSSDRGMVLPQNMGLPFAYPVTNAVTGAVEIRLATFMLQAIAAAAIVAVLLIWSASAKARKKDIRDGDVCLLFLASYGASQILLDSTRYDSLYLGGSGFFSMVQLLGLVLVLAVIAVFSIRLVRSRGITTFVMAIWIVLLAMTGVVVYMEYHVQNHADQANFAYTVMTIGIMVIVALTVMLRYMGCPRAKKVPRRHVEVVKLPNDGDEASADAAAEKAPVKKSITWRPAVPGSFKGSGLIWFACIVLLCVFGGQFLSQALLGGLWTRTTAQSTGDSALMDKFDMYMTNEISNALDGVLSVEKVYWLSDSDLVAPEPNQECYGTTSDPSTLQWLLDDAQEILDGQDTLFTTETPVFSGTDVMYYLDETIFAVTWKQQMGGCMYTISEVKIADASQFRRFLAGGEYGSDKQYTTTEMAASVNAVVASSGDFYKYRRQGVIVYDGTVQRVDGVYVDTCFIDDKGDMLFAYRGDLTTMEQAQQYVDENNIRFSVAFGPVLIDDYERVVPWGYALGEIDDHFPRAALGQRDELHYVLVVCNLEYGYNNTPHIWNFTDQVEKLGCKDVYTLDGGQTGVIVMNDQLINAVHFGAQRQISDIIYFATALQDGG